MIIDDKTVEKIATLSKLQFEGESKSKIKDGMNKMLSFFEQLNKMDTNDVEPLIYMTDQVNILREDVSINNTTQKQALQNAPKKDSDYFRIPKVLK